MSTNDEYEIFRGPCECGRGQFIVIESEPDHPYARASQRSWSTQISCEACTQRYRLVHQGQDFLLVRLTDLEMATDAAARSLKLQQAFMQRSEVAQLRQDVVAFLSTLTSKAAVQRAVSRAGFFVMSPSTFVRRYSSAQAWVSANISRPEHVDHAYRLLGRAADALSREAAFLVNTPTGSANQLPVVRILDIHAGH